MGHYHLLFSLHHEASVHLCSEKDAQMCIYHVSWQSNFGFCCELDDECAQELAGKCVLFCRQPTFL